MGFCNETHRLRATGFATPDDLRHGPVTFISHSGSAFAALAFNDRGIGFNLLVSSGQEVVTTMADYMDYSLSLASTRVKETLSLAQGCQKLIRGRRYLQIARWTERQRVRAAKSKFPEPPPGTCGQMPASVSELPHVADIRAQGPADAGAPPQLADTRGHPPSNAPENENEKYGILSSAMKPTIASVSLVP